MPFDPLNPGDIFRSPDLERSTHRRRRTLPAEPLSPQEQEAADEVLARRLQEQELRDAVPGADNDHDAAAQQRRRASRRARRNVYAVTGDDAIHELGENEEEYPLRSGG
jgi:hypothetical protein